METPMSPTPMRALRILALIAAVAAGRAAAQNPAKPAAKPADAAPAAADAVLTGEAATVKKLLEQRFPGATLSHVAKTPYFGLYEAQFDSQMVYTDAKVTYVIIGSIYDAATRQNLTEDRLRKLNRVAFDSLPLDTAIKKVKGNGTRKLAVFSDADCPFCARLETELKGVDDITIYTFLYPIDQLHPDAARKSKMIWCAPDRTKAWDEFFASGKLPDNKGDCETPLAATLALGQKLRVNATPTLVFADGSIIPGALPRDRLEAELTQAAAEAKKAAAAAKK
jgi:thiol:disulfide interchange protein DsbC